MSYWFDLVGISPVVDFFHHQVNRPANQGPAYLGVKTCKLDAFLTSLEPIPATRGWNLDEVVDTVVAYWVANESAIRYWRDRLIDSGEQNVLVARVADAKALQLQFESLLGR